MRRTLPVVHSKAARRSAILRGWGGDQGRERFEIVLDSAAWFMESAELTFVTSGKV